MRQYCLQIQPRLLSHLQQAQSLSTLRSVCRYAAPVMVYPQPAQYHLRELGWRPQETFDSGIRKTVQWYLDNQEWCRRVQDGSYQRERLGVGQ